MIGLVMPGPLRAVDDPTDAGIDRKPLAIGLATAAASAAGTTIAGTAFACKEQPDGKIVVVGNTQRTLLVMRFNAEGIPDAAFGDNGMFLLTGVDVWYEGGAGLDLQSDGSIVIATRTYTTGADSAILVRLTPAGQLDMTFAGSGVMSLNTPDRAYAKRVFVLPDGKILAGGNYPSGIWVARCLANGDPDMSFGTNGKSYIQQSTQNNFNGQIGQLLPLPDGKMLLLSLGIISDTREAWVVNRLMATGAMDPTFTRISLPYDGTNTYIGAMARLNDGRIAVTIPRFDVSYPIGDMVALYSEDGVPQSVISDTTFAGSRGTAKWDIPNSLVVRTDGSLCGLLGTRLVQFLPTLQVLSTESSASGLQESRLYPLADGGLLKSGSLVRRYASNGALVLTYTVATSTNFAYPPDISVEQFFSPILDGGSRTFASAVVNGAPSTLTFTIRNTGLGDLNDLAISLSGTHAGDFSFSAIGATTIAAGGGRSFTVSFSPKDNGTRTAKLQIASNDADENPFNITLTGQGTGLAPEIAVESPTSITDGGSLTLNSVNVGEPALTRSFTIRNTGSANLTGLAISFTGTHATDFSATALTSSTLAVGGSQSFTVSFAPKAAGARTAKMLIASNDADENPFDITLNGQGNIAAPGGPRMVVSGQLGQVLVSSTPTVVGWGNSASGETTAPTVLSNAVAIAAGQYHSVALRQNGTVVAWGGNYDGQTQVPVGLAQVVAIAAGGHHTVALKQNGSVVGWGANYAGQTAIPPGLGNVVAITAGASHTVALKNDGSVVAWGRNAEGQTQVPSGLTGVVAISSHGDHTVALKQNGTVVAWGANSYGQRDVPVGLGDVVSVAAGGAHTVALTRDGGVIAWGLNYTGQATVPAGLSDVIAVAAGGSHTIALKRDGTLAAWGFNAFGQNNVPTALTRVTAIAAGSFFTLALGEVGQKFATTQVMKKASLSTTITNTGTLPLTISRAVIEGADAHQFSFSGSYSTSIAVSRSIPFIMTFLPTRVGRSTATLKIYSNDPQANPFTLNLFGTGIYSVTATKPNIAESAFTYAPLTIAPTTGSILQKMTFANPTGTSLNGLRLILHNVVPGIAVSGSSVGDLAGTLEVIYSKPIAAGETVQFYLTYFDSKRRTTAAIQPFIRAEALMEPEPRSPPVEGTLSPILGVRDTVNGPLVEWNCKPCAVYVVEYSDDRGVTWFSAVHRLTRNSMRMMWIDRGQPETFSKPLNKAARSYRVKRL